MCVCVRARVCVCMRLYVLYPHQISSSGYISLPVPIGQIPDSGSLTQQISNPVLAPLWSSNDPRFGRVHYQIYDASRLRTDLNLTLSEDIVGSGFSPELALKVTWTNMRAFPAGPHAVRQGLSDLGVSHCEAA